MRTLRVVIHGFFPKVFHPLFPIVFHALSDAMFQVCALYTATKSPVFAEICCPGVT